MELIKSFGEIFAEITTAKKSPVKNLTEAALLPAGSEAAVTDSKDKCIVFMAHDKMIIAREVREGTKISGISFTMDPALASMLGNPSNTEDLNRLYRTDGKNCGQYLSDVMSAMAGMAALSGAVAEHTFESLAAVVVTPEEKPNMGVVLSKSLIEEYRNIFSIFGAVEPEAPATTTVAAA